MKLISDLELEVKLLRRALRTYGNRQRMSMAADPALQQAIDRAMADTENSHRS
jgi:histone H3/H4